MAGPKEPFIGGFTALLFLSSHGTVNRMVVDHMLFLWLSLVLVLYPLFQEPEKMIPTQSIALIITEK